MTQLAIRRWDPETALVAWIASVVSVASFFYYFHRGELLLYGDAVAHINIARRVFDSRTPGLLQLGTVWLPLPHLAMIPFLVFVNRKSTRLNSSHGYISYAVFCLKKKKKQRSTYCLPIII